MIWRIALHETRRLRAGLLFWLLLAITQLLIAWLGFAQLEAFATIAPQLKAAGSTIGATDLVITPTLNSLVLLLLLGVPLLAMGSVAGEVRSGRIDLWLAAPVRSGGIALGKTLGLWLASLPLVATGALTVAALGLAVDVDWPRLILAAATLALFSLWLASLTLCLSAWLDHPAAALAASYGLLLFLWLLDSLSSSEAPWYWLALLPHIEPMLKGLLRSQDVAFFAATGAAGIMLGAFRLARRRGET